MPKLLWVMVALLLLAACAGSPTIRTDPDKGAGQRALVPVEIDFETPSGWQVLQREHYESAELGTRMRIRLDEWPWVRMDLFAYRVGVTDNLTRGLEQVVTQHRDDLDAAVEQGAYQRWTALEAADFKVDGHPLLSTGKRLSLRIVRGGDEEGSTSYLFYRPPFALKVRASYPGHVDARTEAAVDAAVRTLIPAVEIDAPAHCADQAIEISVPDDDLDEAEGQRFAVVGFAAASLRYALEGCMDLAGAMVMARLVCDDFGELCGTPPWEMAGQEP